jgi:hypothetical protein
LITSNPTNSESAQYDSPEEELRAINEKIRIQRETIKAQISKNAAGIIQNGAAASNATTAGS